MESHLPASQYTNEDECDVQWLIAVELGLLKGRHPLLKDVDMPFELTRDLAHEEHDVAASFWLKSKTDSSEGYSLSQSDSLNGYATSTKMFGETESAASFWLASKTDSGKKLETEHTGPQDVENGALVQTKSNDSGRKSETEHTKPQDAENGALIQTKSDDPELVNEEEVSPADGERGQVLQTAHVVMNMLDVTMPNILTEERKKKVML